jgi:hypothetical protein
MDVSLGSAGVEFIDGNGGDTGSGAKAGRTPGQEAMNARRTRFRSCGAIEAWRSRPIEGEHPYLYLDGIVMKAPGSARSATFHCWWARPSIQKGSRDSGHLRRRHRGYRRW